MCNCIQEAIIDRGYELPFIKPIVINQKTHALESEEWAVKLYTKTKSGNISKSNSASLFINYCPICGTRLSKEG